MSTRRTDDDSATAALSDDVEREAAERTRLALEASQLGTWNWDAARDRFEADARCRAICGYAPSGTLTIEEATAAIHPDDRARIDAALRKAIAPESDGPYAEEFRFVHADGSVRWVSTRARALFEEHEGRKRARRIVGVTLDISERRETELALQETNRRLAERSHELETLIDVLPVGVWIADETCERIVGNRAAYEMLGLPAGINATATPSGDPHPRIAALSFLVDGRAVPPEELPVQRAAFRGEEIRHLEHQAILPSGAEITFDANVAPLRDAQGRLRGAVAAYIDITERKRMERALRASEDRFRVAIESSPVGFTIVRAIRTEERIVDFAWLHLNPTAARLLGRVPADLVGRPISTSVLGTWNTRGLFDAFVRVVESRRPERIEVESAAEGVVGCFAAVLAPFEDGLVIWFDDITARKADERALRVAEERWRSVVASIPGMAIAIDPERPHRFVSRYFYDYTGRPPDEPIETSWNHSIHPDDAERNVSAWRGLTETGAPFNTELRFRRHDGEYRWFQVRGIARRDAETGRVVEWFGNAVDIHDLKESEERLRTAQAELRKVTDLMAAGVTRCSRDYRYLWASRRYGEWLGHSAADIAGRPIEELIGAAAFAALRPYFDRVLAGESLEYETEVEFARIGRRWIHAAYEPTRDASGAPDGWVAVVTDITARKQIENQLSEADRRKDEFLATLAHELRNPLAALSAASHLLVRSVDGPAATRAARETLVRQVEQMSRLLDDLLDVSRITRGKLTLRAESVALREIVEAALDTSRPTIEAKRHRLELDLPDQPVRVVGDALRLGQVLANLLTNAAKYTDPGGTITVRARAIDDELVLSVADTGIGIAAASLPKIFEMFSQVHAALERAEGGLGIGLALTKGLVEMHGGSIAAESAGPGRGSTFTIRLPIGAAPARSEPARADSAPRPTRRNILIVDDNRDALESLARLLELDGHEVGTASDGARAIELAAARRPDVVLLDIGMPSMDGYEVARRLRATDAGRDALIIAVSGWGQAEVKRRANDAGFDHHLTKPVDWRVLRSLLASLAPAQGEAHD